MTIIKDKAVAAVAATAAQQEKKKYAKRDPIFQTKFSFTDQNMARAKHIVGKKYLAQKLKRQKRRINKSFQSPLNEGVKCVPWALSCKP